MPLSLYRRHRHGCEAGRAEESRSGEFDERKKGWKRCACVIFASGSLGGEFSRKATGASDWVEAQHFAETYERRTLGAASRKPSPSSLILRR